MWDSATDSAMFAANDLLANPPVVGLALSRSLGFTVVARLAAAGLRAELDELGQGRR